MAPVSWHPWHVSYLSGCELQQVLLQAVAVQVKDDISSENAEAMLDTFWSLQYMIPAGVLNGFAGCVVTMHAAHAKHTMTHALHLRFGSIEVSQHPQI